MNLDQSVPTLVGPRPMRVENTEPGRLSGCREIDWECWSARSWGRTGRRPAPGRSHWSRTLVYQTSPCWELVAIWRRLLGQCHTHTNTDTVTGLILTNFVAETRKWTTFYLWQGHLTPVYPQLSEIQPRGGKRFFCFIYKKKGFFIKVLFLLFYIFEVSITTL